MADPISLNRNQIARFVGNDPDAIRAIERLFQVAGTLTPSDIATLTQLILDNTLALGAADNKAEVALSVATDAKRLADLAATAPASLEQRLDQLQDVKAFGPADGSILIYNATQQAWLPTVGASGSFLAGIQTVTVVNGIITSIV
jgi:hypothetical protein